METAIKTEKLKIGFLGVGWIGRHRMKSLMTSNFARVAAVADTASENALSAAAEAPGAKTVSSINEMLEMGIDGLVIATPSALHSSQAIEALNKGIPVFCQKPLGRDFKETRAVVDAARKADKLLGVDFCYRYTAFSKLYDIVKNGEIGEIYSADLVFHNAYGPDKAWFYNPELSGGGCVVDLGVHLIDLALWTLDFPLITKTTGSLYQSGKKITDATLTAEDYAVAHLETHKGTSIRLACSWNLSAGKEAVIEATFYGTNGAVSFKNVNGSFYDFKVEKYYKTTLEGVCLPPDDWGGRAINAWAHQLYVSDRFDERAEEFCHVAEVMDRIYNR